VSESGEKRRFDRLSDVERRERPRDIRALTFDDVARPGPTFRDTSRLVPIESVQAGDRQVFAARGDRFGVPLIDLDGLAAHPTVESIVASTEVRARTPLPHIRELLLFGMTVVPDAETLANFPCLERLWAAWAPRDRKLSVSSIPNALQRLGVCRHILADGDAARPRFSELTRFSALKHLTLKHCWPKDSIAPVAALAELTELWSDAPLGWAALRPCAALERVSAIRPRVTNLRSLRSWERLRTLLLMNPGVGSLDGLEAFTALESLRLVLLNIDSLTPVRGLPRLRQVELEGLNRLRDISPLGALPSLRVLHIARVGAEYQSVVHIDSVRPLAAATTLEEVALDGVIVDDRDLTPLAGLPALRRVSLFGDVELSVDTLRRLRRDLDVKWRPMEAPPGERMGTVFLRHPTAQLPRWWIREDLTNLFGVQTNAEAEARLRRALMATGDATLLSRVNFDTEADAVSVDAPSKDDLLAVVRAIEKLQRPATGRG
jgi:hypothetical protein